MKYHATKVEDVLRIIFECESFDTGKDGCHSFHDLCYSLLLEYFTDELIAIDGSERLGVFIVGIENLDDISDKVNELTKKLKPYGVTVSYENLWDYCPTPFAIGGNDDTPPAEVTESSDNGFWFVNPVGVLKEQQ